MAFWIFEDLTQDYTPTHLHFKYDWTSSQFDNKKFQEDNMISKMKESLHLFKLSERKLKVVKGGHCCCACLYADSGGSSMLDNMHANEKGGLHSPVPIC